MLIVLRVVFVAVLFCIQSLAVGAVPSNGTASYAAYLGNYRVAPGHDVGISRFVLDSGEEAVLISDYQSGVVRRLFPVSPGNFEMGPGFDQPSPAELRVRFDQDEKGRVSGLTMHPVGGKPASARRLPIEERSVTIDANGRARLVGTLMLPPATAPRPAIILLHGSGPLTRDSFGPYPRFFASLGFAVLIFDKRGTGESSGTRLDASTGASAPLPDAFYPDDLISDATAVFRFLQRQDGIDPARIGFWGSSEGGMLTTQVAARNPEVAFAINSSGFVGPLWETLFYQAGAKFTLSGRESQAEEARDFARLWMRVARTGRGYPEFEARRQGALRANKKWLLSYVTDEYRSVAQMRWDWDHILSFDSRGALRQVRCPVLGVFGEQDPLTDAKVAASALAQGLKDGGNADVTVKIFPNAGHSLSELPDGKRMAPGVFDTLRSWLLQRVPVPHASDARSIARPDQPVTSFQGASVSRGE